MADTARTGAPAPGAPAGRAPVGRAPVGDSDRAADPARTAQEVPPSGVTQAAGAARTAGAAQAAGVTHAAGVPGPVPAPRSWPAVDVVVLSWRAADKTVPTLRSLAGCGYPNLRVVVVDNGSDDGSDDAVWAEFSELFGSAWRIEAGTMAPTPDAFRRMLQVAARRHQRECRRDGRAIPDGRAALHGPVMLCSGVNRGYSGGMNLGLQFVRSTNRAGYFWTVNNDMLVMPGAIEALVTRCEEDRSIGLCGATNHVYRPDGRLVLSLPGGFRYRRGVGRNAPIPLPAVIDGRTRAEVEAQMFGITGSAVFGTRRFLDDVGLFATDRFLYNEEHDWANRARKAGFRLGWAPQAEVRNIQATTLESVQHEDRLVLTRYLGARARVRYGMVHDRLFVPVLAGAQIGRATLDVLHGHRRAARSGLRGLLDGFTGRHRSFEQLGPAVYPGVVRS